MGQDSKIEWTDHTFNPWIGCTKVSPGCTHCYAEALAKRTGLAVWGPEGTRERTSAAYWKQPYRWAKAAVKAGTRARVFCASLADVCEDRPELILIRADLCQVIRDTAYALDWLLLSKRPENFTRLFPTDVLELCWIGATTEDQQRADGRIPHLLQTPAALRFLSTGPLLGSVTLGLNRWIRLTHHVYSQVPWERGNGAPPGIYRAESNPHGALSVCTSRGLLGVKPGEFERLPGIDLVIVEGESGFGARPMHVQDVRSVRDQCIVAGALFFFKQWGDHCPPDQLPEDVYRELEAADPSSVERPGPLRVGKKSAGALLDGREWREMPEVRR